MGPGGPQERGCDPGSGRTNHRPGIRQQAGGGRGGLPGGASAGEFDVLRFTGHTGQAFCAAFSPDGRLLASGGVDRMSGIWRPNTRGSPLTRVIPVRSWRWPSCEAAKCLTLPASGGHSAAAGLADQRRATLGPRRSATRARLRPPRGAAGIGSTGRRASEEDRTAELCDEGDGRGQ